MRTLLQRLPLTGSGWATLVIGVLAYLAGWRFGWIELMIVAAGCLVLLVAALPFVVGRLALEMEREIVPVRVTRGQPADGVLRIRNGRKLPTGSRVVEDHIDQRRFRLEIPGLAPGRTTVASYPLPTAERGVVTVGPAVIVKADPLGMMRREVRQTGTADLWVHPRIAGLPALPVGFAKDLEGPTSDASPAGDVAFHALRTYEMGDDHRHIHWMSSARTGDLMVRHYVDNRRPHLTIVIDDASSSYPSRACLDHAVEIAGSLAMSSLLAHQPVALWMGSTALLGRGKPVNSEQLLDSLTVADTVETSSIAEAARVATRFERGTSAVAIVTGPRPVVDFLPLTTTMRREARIIVVRVWPQGERTAGVLPGATLLDVDDLDTFQLAWKGVTR